MSFHEVVLASRLTFGSTGGLERRTEITTLASGHERRTTPWAQGRRRYLIGARLRSLDDIASLTAFFEARGGPLHGFRFRDFADFKSCAPSEAPAGRDQPIGEGDGERTLFQLVKSYGESVRTIRKPVATTVEVSVDGDAAPFTVDVTTGLVTLATPPPPGAVVSAGFAFDTPVRFDADRIEVTLEGIGVGRMVAMPLVEVRVEP